VEGTRVTPPLLSIISVVYRDCAALEPLMESVFAHANDDTEIIVIDGGSSDGTLDRLQRWNDKIDYWLSEKDTGIYDAMNKGIFAATGEYILHLNAGDSLIWIPTAHLMQCKLGQVDVACFDVLIDRKTVYHPRAGLILRIDNSWHHQGTFYRRVCHPGYDTRYQVFGDFDANQRLYKRGCAVRVFSGIVSGFSTGGASSTASRKEVYRIIRKNYGLIYLPIAWVRFRLNALRRVIESI
jgi:glycosyltransferase involved in cell wall biosynthesis